MASIRQRNGRWHVQVRKLGYPSLNDSFTTKADALRWAREKETEMDKGKFIDAADLKKWTVKGLLEKFLAEKVPSRKGKRWENVRIKYLVGQDFALRRLDQDVPGALRTWVAARARVVSAATVRRDLTLISSIFSTALKEWALPLNGNPVSLIKRPEVEASRRGQVWTAEDFARLKQAAAEQKSEAGGKHLAMDFVVPALELSIETAMRRGELCAFTLDNVYLAERRIWLPDTKNGSGRNVLLSTRAVEILEELLKLPRRAKETRVIPVNADTLGLRFRQLRATAGLKGLRLHDGRHTAATRASKVFDNVLELSAFTGHKSLQTLKGYYHPDATEMAKRLG